MPGKLPTLKAENLHRTPSPFAPGDQPAHAVKVIPILSLISTVSTHVPQASCLAGLYTYRYKPIKVAERSEQLGGFGHDASAIILAEVIMEASPYPSCRFIAAGWGVKGLDEVSSAGAPVFGFLQTRLGGAVRIPPRNRLFFLLSERMRKIRAAQRTSHWIMARQTLLIMLERVMPPPRGYLLVFVSRHSQKTHGVSTLAAP